MAVLRIRQGWCNDGKSVFEQFQLWPTVLGISLVIQPQNLGISLVIQPRKLGSSGISLLIRIRQLLIQHVYKLALVPRYIQTDEYLLSCQPPDNRPHRLLHLPFG
jgi:hypothetical protein